jgi:hypothetical protein
MDIMGNIIPRILTKIIIYFKDILRTSSRTAEDVWISIAASQNIVSNCILCILNIYIYMYYDIHNVYNTLENYIYPPHTNGYSHQNTLKVMKFIDVIHLL